MLAAVSPPSRMPGSKVLHRNILAKDIRDGIAIFIFRQAAPGPRPGLPFAAKADAPIQAPPIAKAAMARTILVRTGCSPCLYALGAFLLFHSRTQCLIISHYVRAHNRRLHNILD